MTTSVVSSLVPPKPSRVARSRARVDLDADSTPWRWPLDQLADEREPLVLAEHVTARHTVALGYDPRPDDGDRVVPVYAAQAGTVALATADDVPGRFLVVIEHGLAWATHYARLVRLHVKANRGTRAPEACEHVHAGDLIGYAGGAPLHLHFALWHWCDRSFALVDPLAELERWGAPALDVVHALDEQGAAAS